MKREPVERTSSITLEAFRERFELPERPVVIEGGARHFEAVRSWGPQVLSRKIGHVEVPHKLSASDAHPDFPSGAREKMFRRGHSRLDEFFRAITTGTDRERAERLFTGDERFLLQRRNGVTTRDPELGVLLDDVEVPELVPEERLYTIWGWFSGRGVRTWLHYDNNGCHNVNAQITGRKRCVLVPPSELPRLAPFPLGGPIPAYNCSQIDADAPDLTWFPGFDEVSSLEAEIEAGDLLFIPAWWFHAFRHLGEFNSNVNFWYKPDVSAPNPVAARQALLDIVASAGLPPGDAASSALLARLDAVAVRGRGS